MFLKSLTIKGFKSFAESATLDLEPGVTVVVGPNGSGKSNVVDAIGWVLGAQAPSAVRSQKMEDVIFAGTTSRPALGRAEVALTIDNSAGLLDIAFSEVTITRTLWRSGDSEYALNGVPCRLLDVQELLSDAGVGRQQHVIISQGQIDAVLNARAEERRMIIEEAAGVLKFRRRKEKAERRLSATEGNLTRLQDLLREVRRQLRPLERQADAARRHGQVVDELTALRIWSAGQELARLRTRLEHGQRARRDLQRDEAGVRARLAALDADVTAAEAELGALGGDDLGDDLARFEALRERARGLAAVLTERQRSIERDRGGLIDEAVVASLEAEAARLVAELAAVDDETARLEPESQRLAAAEAELAAARARFQEDWQGAELIAPSGRAAEVRGELGARRSGVERAEAEAARTQARLDQLAERERRLEGEIARLARVVAEADAARPALAAGAQAARVRLAEAEAAAEAADAEQRAAAGEQRAWAARAEALASALDEARARAGVERLAGVEGVLGTLVELVEVDTGYEAAFEAAAGEALAAVVVADEPAARRALQVLSGEAAAGTVLPGEGPGGRPAVPGFAGGEPLRPKVRGRDAGVEGLLDSLLGAVVVAPRWADAIDVVLASPGTVAVTRDGDRFAVTGWRLGASGRGATGAALEEARSRAAAAQGAARAANELLGAARAALDGARRDADERARALDQATSRGEAAADALGRLETDRGDREAEAASLARHLAELAERISADRQRVEELAGALPELEREESDAAERGRALTEGRRALEERAAAVGALRSELEVRSAGLDERRQLLRRRAGEVEARLAGDAAERERAGARRVELERRGRATERLLGVVTDRLALVEADVALLRERRRRQSEAAREVAARLDGLRKQRAEAERGLGDTREQLQRAELEHAEVQLRIETHAEAMRRDLDVDPDTALAASMPAVADGTTPVARVRELERELRLMGPINPLALEEFTALQERHEFLEAQLEDVKASRRELSKVIRAVDAEIVQVFAAAYADVASNFTTLFEMLFPGGQGRLRLTEPDDLLGTGIELEARPSGKNVKKLSLLSGGERSLTALAYLFSVFRARPSPFYVMDEVEAALDDVNLHRFLGLLGEFRTEAQLIVVSHQKRTMEAADLLYGVTMQPGGSSKVVAEKIR
ncbi:MAG: chromosome segregation protein SMC [Actinobacteria bacterium]|nr:chromosome segregation protein SMC [Actinomycetota bacterium]